MYYDLISATTRQHRAPASDHFMLCGYTVAINAMRSKQLAECERNNSKKMHFLQNAKEEIRAMTTKCSESCCAVAKKKKRKS